MVVLSQIKCCLIFVLCLAFFLASSASTFISDADGVFGSPFGSERRLLQVKKYCLVDFQSQNYTIITSQCKEPDYSPKLCCSAFKEFACPFADELNDLTTDCAEVMFSYINRIGNYPNGLFASLCREKKEGLECPADPSSSSLSEKDNKNSGSRIICQMLMITVAAFVQFL
ncbi:hypothetical protein CDL12_02142 [Handroanthus impetiginosus]|uniref:GPI-anchored protein LLG1-like domain-containing protein n=1 Tax=Handroanthus impetiginosus TaxID=429701 RepID=A0A2G9I5T8_9LAMI|nr:hypothetical protein CDL12_02142 [Handroanthus impetiginosus]